MKFLRRTLADSGANVVETMLLSALVGVFAISFAGQTGFQIKQEFAGAASQIAKAGGSSTTTIGIDLPCDPPLIFTGEYDDLDNPICKLPECPAGTVLAEGGSDAEKSCVPL